MAATITPLIQPGTVVDASKYGVTASTGEDRAAALQSVLRPGTTVLLPAASAWAWSPVLVTQDGVTIRGAGESLSKWNMGIRCPAFLVGPFGDTTPDGFTFSAGGRPDLFGLADASLATAPGQAWGFATQGRTILHSTSHGLQLGASVPGQGWDYHGGTNGFTVEGLFQGTFNPGVSVFGWGSNDDPVGPGCCARNSQTPSAVTFFVAFDDEPEGVTHSVSFDGVDWSRPVWFRFWYDPVRGEVGCWVNRQPLKPSWYGAAPNLLGRTMRKNRKGYPFHIGATSVFAALGLSVAPAVWGGFRVSAVARREAPANHRASLLTYDAGTVACLMVDRRDPGRLVRIKEGPGAENFEGFALALDAKIMGDPVSNFTLEDLTVSNGSPAVLLYNTLTPRLRRVSTAGGRLGLGCVRFADNYPLKLDDCTFFGSDCGVDLYATFGVAVNTAVGSGGVTSIRDCGSGMDWDSGLFSAFGYGVETAFDLWGEGNFACQTKINGFKFDNEQNSFKVANVRAATVPGGSRSLEITGSAFSNVGPGKPAILLTAKADHKPAEILVRGCQWPVDGSIAVRCEGPAKWYGSVETRGCIPPMGPSGGPGFDPKQLSVQAMP